MTFTPRRIILGTCLVWLVGTCAWGAFHIHSILNEDPRVLWGEPYVYTFSFQLLSFVLFWLPRSLLIVLLPVLAIEFLVMQWTRSSAHRA